MEFEIIIKFVVAACTVIGAGKIFYEIKIERKSRLREDYRFAKDFLEDIKNNPNLHPFAVEKGYHAIAGSVYLKSEEVAYILSLKNPGKCLNDYVFSKKYLKLIDTDGNFCLKFYDKYSSPWFRRLRKAFYLFLYFVFAFIALSPFVISSILEIMLFITLPVFGYFALSFLNSFIQIGLAEKLINNQNRHTQKILLSTENFSSLK